LRKSDIIARAVKRGAAVYRSAITVTEPNWIPHTPWPRQKLFLELPHREAMYGGAAGGGKTDALAMEALKDVNVPGHAVLVLMRSYADLTKPGALMDRMHEWLAGTAARWNESQKKVMFPSGAVIDFGYLENENDKFNYRSAEYQKILFDEVTRFTETQYTYMFTRLRRLKNFDVPLKMRSGTNPASEGEPGIFWVKDRFIPDDFRPIDAAQMRVFEKEGLNAKAEKVIRAFVPARVKDNPALDADEYIKSLDELDPVTRERYLEGDWQIQARGNIYWMYSEAHHVITWGQFRDVFKTKASGQIPMHW